MDIGSSETLGSMSGVLSYASDYNAVQKGIHEKAVTKMNTAITNAGYKGYAEGKYEEGDAAVSGVFGGLDTARTIGEARNFDSQVAGFGTGKGASGYLRSQPQIMKARFQQGSLKAQRAVGVIDDDEEYRQAVNNPRKLGLTQDLDGDGEYTIRGADTTGVEFGKDAGKDVEGIKASAQGEEMAKASGGVLGATNLLGDSGIKGSMIKKFGKFASDLPTGQLSAAADVIGKGAGLVSAGQAIYDLSTNKHKSGIDDWSDGLDLVSAGLDTASIAMPMLAPVAGIAGVAAGITGFFKEESDTKEEQDEIRDKGPGKDSQGLAVGDLASQGKVAQQSVSAY